MRLDHYITQTYGFTRNKSQQLIEAGLILVNEKIVTKVSYPIQGQESVQLQADKSVHWVSRSAGKLDGFLNQLKKEGVLIDMQGKNALDIGSSTGGFTQILLERGIEHVDAVDVGTNQLHEKIKQNPKVTSYEQTDIRNFIPIREGEDTPIKYDIVTCDVSFISLHEILPHIIRLSHIDTDIFVLFKPQFEVGREHLRKTGVPRDKQIVEQKLQEFEQLLYDSGLKLIKKSPATVIGEAGNEEWMMWVRREE